MNGIEIGIDPTLAQLGPFALRWYSLFFTLAIAAGVWLGLREAYRKGLDRQRIQSLAMWAVAGGMVGARLFHVVDRWDLYEDDPVRVFNVWEGGLAVLGGLAGGALGALVYAVRHGLPAWKVADAAAPAAILGQAVGRLACIPNGDALGSPTSVPWAFIYTNPMSMAPHELLGVPTHPYAVYELLFDLAVFALLWRLRTVLKLDGLLFVTYLAVYGVGRFLLSYYRVERVWFWGLQEAQVIALTAVILALVLLCWKLSEALRTSGEPVKQPA